MFHFGVKRSENDAEMKVMYTSRASQGKDFGPKKYSSRNSGRVVSGGGVVHGVSIPQH